MTAFSEVPQFCVGPVGKRGDMKLEVHKAANLTPAEQAALRTLSLAVYPPEVSAAWPGNAIEWAAARWSVIGWDTGGEALCHVGVVLTEARWNESGVRIVGNGGVKTQPVARRRGFTTTAIQRALDFVLEERNADLPNGSHMIH